MATLLATATWSQADAGSGFYLPSQSTTTLGTALAGMTAAAQDISYMAFNPAALSPQSGRQLLVDSTLILLTGQFDPQSATTVLGPATPITGNDGGDYGGAALIPNLYGMIEVTPELKFGLAVSSFFGLASDWDSGWVGRYHALKTELQTININPVVSYQIHPLLTVGAGFQAQYADIELTNAIDFGTIDQVVFGGIAGGIPAGSDGSLKITGDSWAYGATFGVLIEPIAGTRFGLGYRSALTHDIKGDADFNLGGAVGQTLSALSGAFVDTGAEAELKLPDTLSFGFYHEIDDQWSVMGDAMWMNWSRHDRVTLQFDNLAQPDQVTVQDWNDSWYLTLGVGYRLNEEWMFRAGGAYDQSPVPDRTRIPAIADADSYWLGIGAEYHPLPNLKFEFAYGHIFTEDSDINLSASAPGNIFRGNLSGTATDSAADYFAVHASYKF